MTKKPSDKYQHVFGPGPQSGQVDLSPTSPLIRPTSPATGLPMGVEQMAKDPAGANLRGTTFAPGVEQQAKQQRQNFVGPQLPGMVPNIVNGVRADGSSAKLPPIPIAPQGGGAMPSLPVGQPAMATTLPNIPVGMPSMVSGATPMPGMASPGLGMSSGPVPTAPVMSAPPNIPVGMPAMVGGAGRPNAPEMAPLGQVDSARPPGKSLTGTPPPPGLGMSAGPVRTAPAMSSPPPTLLGARPGGPTGRSSRDPQRIVEQLLRRKDPRGIAHVLNMQAQTKSQEFQREMTGRGEARDDFRYQQNRQDSLDREQRQNDRENQNFERDTQRRQNETAEDRAWRESEARRRAEEGRNMHLLPNPQKPGEFLPSHGVTGNGQVLPLPQAPSAPQMVPIPGTDDYIPQQDGRPIPGTGIYTPEAPPADGVGPSRMVPKAEPAKEPKFTVDPDSKRVFWMEPDGKGGYIRRWAKDENGDGVPDNQQQGPGTPVQQSGATASGNKFSIQ